MTPFRPPLILPGDIGFEDAVTAIVDHHMAGAEVTRIERTPWIYASTFALDEVQVQLAPREQLTMLLKDLGCWAPLISGRPAPRRGDADPRREVDMYASLLDADELDTPRCYGVLSERAWLFLEKVDAVELSQVGDFGLWEAAARWLAVMHDHFAIRLGEGHDLPPSLLDYDATVFRSWMDRAGDLAVDTMAAGTLQRLDHRFGELVERLAAVPRTLIHGEFYASNVLVRRTDGIARVRTVDWESAGVGPRVLDLGALLCGWGLASRERLLSAYVGVCADPVGDLVELVDVASVALAVHWLGWVHIGEPPLHQVRDWLQEAQRAMERLGW